MVLSEGTLWATPEGGDEGEFNMHKRVGEIKNFVFPLQKKLENI